MLYDLFICHSSEDKENFVRPLAELLQKENVKVWYDEFSLKLGDSIRRSIDKGLSQSRFGVVVISPSFLKKEWPQYELDGLTEKEISAREKVILPIWHNIDYKTVLKYSPPLANKKAALTSKGINHVVKEIMGVIHPQGSPLISARDTLLDWGVTPPVVTDEYWIDVIEASNRSNGFGAVIPQESIWGRWSFPLPPKEREAKVWGERLAWTAMQLSWTKKAESIPISPLTNPKIVLDFIYEEPGLFETCLTFPGLIAEYAPQLTIRKYSDEFEDIFEKMYQDSLTEGKIRRNEDSNFASALTIDGKSPECDKTWALRHRKFGYYDSKTIAHSYFHGEMFGPIVSPFYDAEHLFWLLSSKSSWLPEKVKSYLIDGMLNSTQWTWGYITNDPGGDWKNNGKFERALFNCAEKKKAFEWKPRLSDDVKCRVNTAIELLGLPENVDDIFNSLIELEAPNKWIKARGSRRKRK